MSAKTIVAERRVEGHVNAAKAKTDRRFLFPRREIRSDLLSPVLFILLVPVR